MDSVMMEETVVDLMRRKTFALYVHALEKGKGKGKEVVRLPISKVMDSVMMEIIMMGVTLMEETVVDLMRRKTSALYAHALEKGKGKEVVRLLISKVMDSVM